MYYSVHGVQAHANMKHKGVSAVEAAIELARDLASWANMPDRKVHPLLGPASVNIGRIEGGIGPVAAWKYVSPTIRPTRPF